MGRLAAVFDQLSDSGKSTLLLGVLYSPGIILLQITTKHNSISTLLISIVKELYSIVMFIKIPEYDFFPDP